MMKLMRIIGRLEKNEWLPYVKNDLLSTAFCYARYIKGMEDLSSFRLQTV